MPWPSCVRRSRPPTDSGRRFSGGRRGRPWRGHRAWIGEGLLQEAASLIRGVAASLAPERSAGYPAAPQVIEVLEAVG